MDLHLLGSLEVVSDGRVAELGPPKQRAVLAILALHAGEIVPTDRLIEQVWGDNPPRTAAHSIQLYVSELRKALDPVAGGPVILTRPPGYVLVAEPAAIDASRFEALLADGLRRLEAGDRPAGAEALKAALGLWHGPALADFAYEEFAQPEIRRLEAMRLDALQSLGGAELELGHEQDVVPLMEAAIRADPLRERCRELLMLALYRSGRHAEALRCYQDYRRILAEELGLDPSPQLRRLEERILLHDPTLGPAAPQAPETAEKPTRNPYKGLRAFGEEDADDFYGRDELVRTLLDAFAGGTPLVAVVGPSGCGKSSVVNAGLVPALRTGALPGSDRWVIANMMPGQHPFEELEAALARALPGLSVALGGGRSILTAARTAVPQDGRLLLVIDQFEEVFSLADEPARLRFLDDLAMSVDDPRGRIALVLTLRGDFYDRPLLHPAFASVFTAGVVNVVPMTPKEIEAAVVGPARAVGVEVDPALLAELVADTTEQPGALPFLQYTVTELFDRRTGPALTLEGYRALGGLRRAVSRRSEEAFANLDEEGERVAVQVFLRLARLGEGARPSRRRAAVGELTALDLDPVVLSDVLAEFGRHRLLSFDRDPVTGDATVEVAHEALLWEWDRLTGWIDLHRTDLRRHQSLVVAVGEWEASGRDPDYLLTGSRLAEYERWSGETTLQLAGAERGFLAAGLERRRAGEAVESARRETQRRLERRARQRLVALLGAIALLVAATTYGALAWLGGGPPDVALAYAGAGDAGWNDMVASGFERAVSDFGIDAHKASTAQGDLDTLVRRLSEEGVGLIVVSGVVAVPDIAAEFPDTRYAWVDCLQPPERPNVSCLTFAEEEGSFLAGAAAALKTETRIIGFIGGVNIPIIHKFQAGYEAGARAVDPSIEVRSTYLTEYFDFSGFGTAPLAWLAADRMYREGADVIYHAAGFSGFGVFRAAASVDDRHVWAIGVDTDQYRVIEALIRAGDNPPELNMEAWSAHVLTSMLKRVDTAVYAALRDYARGILTPGERRFGLADGGIDIAYTGGFIDDIRDELDAFRSQIVSGDIEVPTVPTGSATLLTP